VERVAVKGSLSAQEFLDTLSALLMTFNLAPQRDRRHKDRRDLPRSCSYAGRHAGVREKQSLRASGLRDQSRDEKPRDACSDQRNNQHDERTASERTLASRVRRYDLRRPIFVVMGRRLDVVFFDRMDAIHLDEMFRNSAPLKLNAPSFKPNTSRPWLFRGRRNIVGRSANLDTGGEGAKAPAPVA
jgi:hypothetical protein